MKVIGNLGGLEITCYSNAKENAINIRNRVLEAFGKHSEYNPKELEFLFKKHPWLTDPASSYDEAMHVKTIKGEDEVVAVSAWDINNCLIANRDGYDQEHTFHPELEEAIRKQIDRLGSFVMVSALTGEQMAWHMVKEELRAKKTGEESLAKNIILSAENGRLWLIPHQENGKTVITEYRLPLSEKQQTVLDKLKNHIESLVKVLRDEGMVAFVNDQKFSKCTMEGSQNGRLWYRETIERVLLPYLAKNGAIWDGNPEKFSLDGVEFAVSPTEVTWEIEITEGADKIGKRFAREILHNTISDILASRKAYGLFRMLTGGDSVKWGGSDAGLTDPNAGTIPFVVPSLERPVDQTMDAISESIGLKRKYWPEYIIDGEKTRLAGPGIAPARFMQAILETVPFLKIPIEEFGKFLAERLVNTYGFKKHKEFVLENSKLFLYKLPEGVTPQQKETFLKAQSDLPIPANDEAKVDELINRINQKLA